MLKFSDWKCIQSTKNVDIWHKKIENINSIFEIYVNHYLNYGECTLHITYNSDTLFDAFKIFSKSKFKEDELYCFDDIENAKTYVENFEPFLNRCMKLTAFL
jgi:hypothetical protein